MKYLELDRPGFSGVNHVLIAIMLFLILQLIRIEPFSSFIRGFLGSPVTAIMSFLVICGGALVPDLDNLKSDGGSAASWDLGVLGSIISSIMVTISSIMTSVFHGKKDVKPDTQHRFFWHTLIVPIIMFLLMFFFLKDGDSKLIESFIPFSIDTFPAMELFCLLMVGICVYVGSSLLLKKIKKIKLFKFKPSIVSLSLAAVTMLICLFAMSLSEFKLISYCIALGYLFHLIGDMFADGGIPALFPFTGVVGKFFMRIKLLPVTVKTGSTLESLLKVVFTVIDAILLYFVFVFNF